MRMKKWKLLLGAAVFMIGLEQAGAAQAAAAPKTIVVENAPWNQGHILVPAGLLAESLGGRIE